jgi:hypothetical protein
MLYFKHFFFYGVGVALFYGSLADPTDPRDMQSDRFQVQSNTASSITKPINDVLRQTRDPFPSNEKYGETYLLKVNQSTCLHSPIELEWTASADHNSQVSDFKDVMNFS